jgi:pimeloyl-ACP methyl ester carboxylesterase
MSLRIGRALAVFCLSATFACAAASHPIPGASQQNNFARLEDAPDEYFSDGDIRIRYREVGRGDPVVFLHGRTNSLEVWSWLADSLASDHRVLALDERGHGKSSKSPDPARYGHAMADDFTGLLDHLGISRASIVGHSQGALLAAFIAMHKPERVTKVALLAGPFFPDSATYAAENAVLVRDLQTGHGFEGFLKARGATDSAARARSAAMLAHNDAPSLTAVMEAQGSLMPDRTLAGGIHTPAVVVAGSNDELLDYNRTVAAWWPGARFVQVPNATHMGILTRPETLAALRAFLK